MSNGLSVLQKKSKVVNNFLLILKTLEKYVSDVHGYVKVKKKFQHFSDVLFDLFIKPI